MNCIHLDYVQSIQQDVTIVFKDQDIILIHGGKEVALQAHPELSHLYEKLFEVKEQFHAKPRKV